MTTTTTPNKKAGAPCQSEPANDLHKQSTTYTLIEQCLIALSASLIVAAIIGGVL